MYTLQAKYTVKNITKHYTFLQTQKKSTSSPFRDVWGLKQAWIRWGILKIRLSSSFWGRLSHSCMAVSISSAIVCGDCGQLAIPLCNKNQAFPIQLISGEHAGQFIFWTSCLSRNRFSSLAL